MTEIAVPLLIEQNEDVAELLRLQLAGHDQQLHHARSVEAAVDHLGDCPHDTVLVGGNLRTDAWRWIYGAVPDGARITLWSSHPNSRIPQPPAGRGIRAQLLLGMPRLPMLVSRLLPDEGAQRGEANVVA